MVETSLETEMASLSPCREIGIRMVEEDIETGEEEVGVGILTTLAKERGEGMTDAVAFTLLGKEGGGVEADSSRWRRTREVEKLDL